MSRTDGEKILDIVRVIREENDGYGILSQEQVAILAGLSQTEVSRLMPRAVTEATKQFPNMVLVLEEEIHNLEGTKCLLYRYRITDELTEGAIRTELKRMASTLTSLKRTYTILSVPSAAHLPGIRNCLGNLRVSIMSLENSIESVMIPRP